jgi:hypothetical protein
MFEFFVARRYLRAKRKQVVISVITVISIIGVAAGVMALVIALAINTGFSSTQFARRDGTRFDSGKRAKLGNRGMGTTVGETVDSASRENRDARAL